MSESQVYDYIIVGAGSAGCVLANRLTEDADVSVLLLEAGPKDHSLFIHMPTALAYPLADDKYNWYYTSEPEPFMDGRPMYCPRGRVLGGSSSINGMAYVRGHARDYDRWAQSGLPGWDYAHALPYFKKAETRVKGGDDYRGSDGPLKVTTGEGRNPLYKAFIDAGVQAGYPHTEDMNGYQQEGFGAMDRTTYRGRRWSTAMAYLRPALKRSNLHLEIGAFTTRVLFEGARATGIEYVRKGSTYKVHAAREVILSGGAINSPQLLMLSGIGPADDLKALDIPITADLPGVGQNLQDHLEIYVQQQCVQPITLYSVLNNPLRKLAVGVEWLLFRSGLGGTNHFESGGFIRSHAGIEHPNLQYHFLPVAMTYDASEAQKVHGFQAHVGPMRPTSRGHVKLRSADPRQHPEILFNYMSTEQDREEMRAAVRLTREVFAQAAFDPFRGPELAPGIEVQSDEQINAFVRQHGESAYHPSCTCKMGADAMAVVDGETRVRGVENLRVIDASIMPTIASGNLNAPTIMMAEKAADMIRGRPPLPPSDAPVYIAPDWQTAQR
jgi:choline dehydrogenase